MTDEPALIKELNLPLLTDADVASLKQLEKEWRHWKNRELEILPLKIAEEQRVAFESFLDNPTAENEQKLAVLADPVLTGTRYTVLRRAFAELRERIKAKAAKIIRPVLTQIATKLQAEYDRRLEKAVPVMSNKRNDPRV